VVCQVSAHLNGSVCVFQTASLSRIAHFHLPAAMEALLLTPTLEVTRGDRGGRGVMTSVGDGACHSTMTGVGVVR
jgi:hypothetical protein